MPKIKKQEDDFDDEDEEDETEDDDELEEQEIAARGGRKPPLPKKAKEEVKRRFGIVAPQPIRIVDTETNELVGEGDFAVIQALTDILERLERIEVQIGAITG